MANTVYANEVIENKLNEVLTTKLDAKNYMTIDDSLTADAGLTIKVHTYTYTGKVEKLAKGAANTTKGSITFSANPYTVETNQQTFEYADEDADSDPKVVEYGLKGAADLMVNDITSKFFTEAEKATLSVTYAADALYDAVVDAIAKLNLEDESGVFVVIGNDMKAAIRKDADFKNCNVGEIIHSGQIGTISGVPVVCSKACPAGKMYVMTKDAITLFRKRDVVVEQDRDITTRTNTVVMRMVNVVALTDNTKICKLSAAG